MSKVNGRHKSSPKFVGLPLDVTAFRGQWVALHPTTYKIIGHGASFEEARQSSPSITRLEPLLYFVPESDAYFLGRAT